MGATIPALMHQIPSELRSLACLGESSTKMGDLLGSLRVAPLLLSFKPVNPLFAADAFTFCARQKVSIAGAGSAGHLGPAGGGESAADGRIARRPSRGRTGGTG
ncbi:hypothetical protein AB3S75_045109 [Citrus x aurantiifolia]